MGVSSISVVRRASSSFGERALRVVARNGRVLERDRVLAVALANHLAVLEGEETALGVLGRWSVNSLWLYAAKKRVEREQQAVQRAVERKTPLVEPVRKGVSRQKVGGDGDAIERRMRLARVFSLNLMFKSNKLKVRRVLRELRARGSLGELRVINPRACRVLELLFLEGGECRSATEAALLLQREEGGRVLSFQAIRCLSACAFDFLVVFEGEFAEGRQLNAKELAGIISSTRKSDLAKFRVRRALLQAREMGLLEELRCASPFACRVLELHFLGERILTFSEVSRILRSEGARSSSEDNLKIADVRARRVLAKLLSQPRELGNTQIRGVLSLDLNGRANKLAVRRALLQAREMGVLEELRSVNPHACRVLELCFLEGDRVRSCKQAAVILKREGSLLSELGMSRLHDLQRHGLDFLESCIEFLDKLPSLSVMELAELLSLNTSLQSNHFKIRRALAELEKMGLLEELRSVSARACRVLELRFLEGGGVRSCRQVAELLQHSEAWNGPASAVSVNSLQRNGFKLLKFVAGRQEQEKTRLGSSELLEALTMKAKFYSDKLRLRRALSQLEGDGLIGVLECFQPLACRVLRMRFVEGECVRVAPEVQVLLEKETSRVFGIYYLKSLEQRGLRALKEIVEGNMPSRTEKGRRFKSVGARDLFSGARTREQVRDILFFGSARETILLFRERFGGIPLQKISRLLLDEERHLRAYSVRCRNTTRNVWFLALGSGSLYVGSVKKINAPDVLRQRAKEIAEFEE